MNLSQFYGVTWDEISRLNIRAFKHRVDYYEHIKQLEEFERAKMRR